MRRNMWQARHIARKELLVAARSNQYPTTERRCSVLRNTNQLHGVRLVWSGSSFHPCAFVKVSGSGSCLEKLECTKAILANFMLSKLCPDMDPAFVCRFAAFKFNGSNTTLPVQDCFFRAVFLYLSRSASHNLRARWRVFRHSKACPLRYATIVPRKAHHCTPTRLDTSFIFDRWRIARSLAVELES